MCFMPCRKGGHCIAPNGKANRCSGKVSLDFRIITNLTDTKHTLNLT